MTASTSIFHSKQRPLPNLSYAYAYKHALDFHKTFSAKSKRKPYVRCKVLENKKVFLTIFWSHLFDKNQIIRAQRLRLYHCAIDLLASTTHKPEIILTKEKAETWYRFWGYTSTKELFVVQVKKRGRSFYLMSTYLK